VGAAQLKLETAKEGREEGDRFLELTKISSAVGSSARDVIKAELQMQERDGSCKKRN